MKQKKKKPYKVTPKNYKKLGYTSYSIQDEDDDGKPLKKPIYRFFVDLPNGHSVIFNEDGEEEGEMS